MAEGLNTKGLMASFVTVFVGVILLGPLNSAITAANISGLAGTVVGYIVTFFGLGLLLASIAHWI